MRHMRRVGAGLLVTVLALSVVACGEKKEENTTSSVESTVEEKKELTIEERVAEASKNMDNLESYESKINLELGFEISFGDEKSEVPLNIESELVAFKNPTKTKFVTKVENPFTEVPEIIEGYTMEENGKNVEFHKEEDEWEVVTDRAEQHSLENTNYLHMITTFLKEGQNVKEVGMEDVLGTQATKVQVEMNAGSLKELYKNDEMLEELLKVDGANLIGEIWLSEDNQVVQCKIDMSSVLKEVSNKEEEDGKATKAIFTVTVDKHNAASDFEIPEEVLKLAE